ncbi:hypothetical protein, unknown function [Leishmania mexicana MHOM/GT/2001/U1103]|uniref:Uncharacterized protein n=1 Tax=Leishmania mexicana (strain MHOM/GT/2001/U1103) TaxID=929439 RepID=E9ALK1_LEIMU|nr:hypothetical protein, unknown function [Leishmania mexicana MHOM/GT/2001/U1103]CBZ23806.1 hypothetical protein, unknown function [Leishmania mexicana MHOM/GT/2001/U1103]
MNPTSSPDAASCDMEKEEKGISPVTRTGKPFVECALIHLPGKYSSVFPFLLGTQLFFFDVVRKLNRIGVLDKRVVFVTGDTIGVASRRGPVSRSSKVEDISKLICDAQARAIGIRMRSRPFAISPKDFPRCNCFHEMPVDLLLHATSVAQYEALINVLSFVHHTCTHEALLCRSLKKYETWRASLVLAPDGLRVKKAMQNYPIPVTPSEGNTGAATLSATRSQETSASLWAFCAPRQVALVSAADSVSHFTNGLDVSAAAPTLQHWPSLSASPSFTPSGVGGHLTTPESSPLSLSSSPAPPLVGLSRDMVAVPTSATRRDVNPLLKADRNDPDTSSKKRKAATRVQL